MQITEHNISNWELTDTEICELIRLAKLEMQKHPENKVSELFYGMIVGKLIIMKND